MNSCPRNLRKAAILLASLDAEHADALLKQMSPAQAHVLRQAVEALGELNAAEQGGVIEEFFRVGPLIPEPDHAGIELTGPLGVALAGVTVPPVPQSADPAGSSTTFRFLREAPPERLVPFLEREHPQTIAVVLSQLPADRAAEVLAQLSGALQIDVARRLVHLEQTDPEILREVERGLEAWLCSQANFSGGQAAGMATLANILDAANPQARHQILANLARYDRKLAEQVEAPAAPEYTFVDLECLDSASLAIVLHHADHEILALALAEAGPLFVERAIELLGPEGHALRRRMATIPHPHRSEIEMAQRRLAGVVRQLDQRGDIHPDVRARLSLAV